MNKCSVCGKSISNKTAHFGLGCLKNMCTIIEMDKVKNLKGETLLNNRIAKLNNKKFLDKENKVLLTNRYLTLQILNKVPISYYDKEKDIINKSINNIGKDKNKSESNMITLKQAYQVLKLYNKFQKIVKKSEEVDSEYIQNYLFDNLLFAFSTYYANKKYLSGVIFNIQKYFWESIVLVLKEYYPSGMEFIEYALQEKPKDRFITDGYIIEEIKNDNKFKNKINELVNLNSNKNEFKEIVGLDYQNTDLFMALNNTTIEVNGIKENNKWNLSITITDRYDFTDFKEIDEYQGDNFIKRFCGSLANNLGMMSIASGVFKEYNVTIQFKIEGWEENE